MLSGCSYPIGIPINFRCVLANKYSLFGWLFTAESCCLMSPTQKRKQILGARCSGSWCTCTLLTLARSSTMSFLFLLRTAVIGKTTSHSWKTFQIFWKVGTDGWTIVETCICITTLFKGIIMQFSTRLKKPMMAINFCHQCLSTITSLFFLLGRKKKNCSKVWMLVTFLLVHRQYGVYVASSGRSTFFPRLLGRARVSSVPLYPVHSAPQQAALHPWAWRVPRAARTRASLRWSCVCSVLPGDRSSLPRRSRWLRPETSNS